MADPVPAHADAPASRRRVLVGLIVLGVLAGGFCGWFWGPKMKAIAFLGTFFLNALRMVVVPLVISSMIVGVSSLGDIRKMGRTGSVTLLVFFFNTILASILGVVLVLLIQPGLGLEVAGTGVASPELLQRIEANRAKGATDALLEVFMDLAPPNIIEAAVKQEMLPLIVFSLAFGAILTTMGARGRPVLDFFQGVSDAILIFVHGLMWLAPIGIFALVASKLGASGGGPAFWNELVKLGKYAGTVIAGLIIHGGIVLPIALYFLARRSPHRYAADLGPALLTAFSTASSAATMPVTVQCLKERSRARGEVVDFVVPLGTTINMSGTALYEAVAALFIGQAFAVSMGFEMTFARVLVVSLTASLAAVGAAAIPEAGLVTMIMVLTAVGYPPEVVDAGIATILVIDWFLDRCRTTINVWDDAVAAAIVERFSAPKTL